MTHPHDPRCPCPRCRAPDCDHEGYPGVVEYEDGTLVCLRCLGRVR